MTPPIVQPSATPGVIGKTRPTFDIHAFAAAYGGVTDARIKPKQTIYAQGDPADCIFYIQEGRVQLTVVSEQGREAVIAILEAGSFCGETCLVGQPLHMATATAMTGGMTARLDKTAVMRAIHDDLAFAEFFVMYVLDETVRLRDNLIDHLFNSSEKRLARVLLLLADYGKEGRMEQVINKVDQQTLAQMVGTTRSRVNFFMNKFRKLGFIEYNGHISVHSSLLSVLLHDQPLGALSDSKPSAE
jgi:CRP-like cAMP-binding protein